MSRPGTGPVFLKANELTSCPVYKNKINITHHNSTINDIALPFPTSMSSELTKYQCY